MSGSGTYQLENNVSYEGEFLCGISNGKGKYVDEKGITFEGWWINGKYVNQHLEEDYFIDVFGT